MIPYKFKTAQGLDKYCRLHNTSITAKSVPDTYNKRRITIFKINKGLITREEYSVGQVKKKKLPEWYPLYPLG